MPIPQPVAPSPVAAGPTTVLTADGLALEARWDLPPRLPERTTVLCHPHPQYGGTMEAPLLRTMAAALTAAGCAVLRFNFRGAGASEGFWGGGDPELGDVAAAVQATAAAFPSLPHGVAGWSFGAVAALRWQAAAGDTTPYLGVAPAMGGPPGPRLPHPTELAPARRLFVLGERDQFTAVADLAAYAAAVGGELRVLPNCDHFFYARERRVAEEAAAHLTGRSGLEAQ